jgi:hypothetical protein
MKTIKQQPLCFFVPYKITNKSLSLKEIGILIVIMALSQGATPDEIDAAGHFFERTDVKQGIVRMVRRGIISIKLGRYSIHL